MNISNEYKYKYKSNIIQTKTNIINLLNSKAIKYYQSTLGYSPDKFDSWAGLALAKSRKITERIDNVRE